MQVGLALDRTHIWWAPLIFFLLAPQVLTKIHNCSSTGPNLSLRVYALHLYEMNYKYKFALFFFIFIIFTPFSSFIFIVNSHFVPNLITINPGELPYRFWFRSEFLLLSFDWVYLESWFYYNPRNRRRKYLILTSAGYLHAISW